MAGKRVARLNEQIRRELTALLQNEVRDPRIGMLTITGVEVTPDLYHAKVYYSMMGDEEERSSAQEGLRAAAGFLRSEIGRRMHIRRAPELHFTWDSSLQNAMRIEQLLQEARASSAPATDAAADGAESDHSDDGENGGA